MQVKNLTGQVDTCHGQGVIDYEQYKEQWNEFEKSMRKARKEGVPTPLLVWFVKEK